MSRRMIAASPGGFYEDNGQRMPLPAYGAVWRNPNTGRVWRGLIDEDTAYWIEAEPIYQPDYKGQHVKPAPPGMTGQVFVTETYSHQPTEQQPMSAIERFTNLDQILADARREAQAELQAKDERIFQLETENTFLKSGITEARHAEKSAQRVTVKLLTQFALVETIFADVKKQALELAAQEAAETERLAAEQPKISADQIAEPSITGTLVHSAPTQDPTPEPGHPSAAIQKLRRS